MIRSTVSDLEGEDVDTLEHPPRRRLRRRPMYTLLLALVAIALPAAIVWIFYGRFEWLLIILIEAAVAYALVATLGRMAPPGATPPAHSFDR
jgi:hypothetical protein